MGNEVEGGSGSGAPHNKTGHVRKLMLISIALAVVVLIVIVVMTR